MKQKLHIRSDVGTGDPLVLLHGLFADGSQWNKIAEILSKDFRVIVVDLLGHGRSPRPNNATYSDGEHVAALRVSLESINATKNVTVVGYSMGGAVALAYSAQYPDEVVQLYLISAPFYLRADQMIAANYASSVLVTKLSQSFFKIVEKLLGEGHFLTRFVSYADGSKKFHKMIGANDNKLDSEIIKLNIKNLVREFDFAGTLEKVKAPTTFYAGKKDPFIVQGQLYALKKFNPYIDIQRLEVIKVDHMLVQNLPKEISKLISVNKNYLLNVGFDSGKGEVLVLLHGIESSSSYWKHLIPALAEHRRVIALDLLGFGNSPKPSNIGYTTEDHVLALHRTLESLNIDNFTLAGHSLGSIIALSYAGKYPDRIKELILFSPVLLPADAKSNMSFLKTWPKIDYLPDTVLLYQQTSRFIGEERLRDFTPTIRSIDNTVYSQDSYESAKAAKNVKTKFYYGTQDPLINKRYITTISNLFNDHFVKKLKGKRHNFVIFSPNITLEALDGKLAHKHQPDKVAISRRSFVQQITRLAFPILILKSAFFILIGLLLFSNYAAATLVIGLTLYVIYKGYRVIHGAFSLRNEGLSYIGYILLGLATILVGYSLYKHPQKSLEIGVLIICLLITVTGITRIAIALALTKSKILSRSLLFSGIPMAIVGLVALDGSRASIYIIIYSIAAIVLFRGVVYSWFAIASFSMAYIRGFDYHNLSQHSHR